MPTIVVDAGHGGFDPGAHSGGLLEKDLTLSLGRHVKNRLAAYPGINTIMTRTTDTFVTLSQRASIANQANADFFLSIHINAGGGEGFESYIYNGRVNNETVQLQDRIHQTVMKFLSAYNAKDRGKQRADFAVLRETAMPAVLLENLFIDNNYDHNLLADANFRQELGYQIGDAIAAAFGIRRENNDGRSSPSEDQDASPGGHAHWAKADHDELLKMGLLKEDHTPTLDSPAGEGMVIALINRLRKYLESK